MNCHDVKDRLETQLGNFGLTPQFIDDVLSHHTLVNYDRGRMLFFQGSPADLLFVIFTGSVKVYSPRSDGTRILVKLAGPGDLIGQVDYLDPKGRRAQVFEAQALTRCSVALFTREHVLKLLQSVDCATLIQLVERLNTTWSSMAQRFGMLLGMSFRERLEFVLRELGAQFGVRDTRGVLLMAELAHSDLAEMIGSSRPMVSRLIDEMTKEGLVLRQRKQYVLLKSLAESTSDSPRQRNQFPGLKSSVATPVVGSAERSLFKNSVATKGGRGPVDPAVVVANGSLKGL